MVKHRITVKLEFKLRISVNFDFKLTISSTNLDLEMQSSNLELALV